MNVIRPSQDSRNFKVKSSEKKMYEKQLKALKRVKTQHINRGRFDQLVRSLTNRMGGGSTTLDLAQLFSNGILNFSQRLEEQMAQLSVYEQLAYHYISIIILIDERSHEIEQMAGIEYEKDGKEKQTDTPFIKMPQKNKLFLANIKMLYVYHLLRERKYDALNGENLELHILFQELNC
mmetsp:Transcript_3252/g.3207  ORF Transcript_3252/g.3207 Transcript_3252/m.3207 type:complete len:178 (-) Transcript_3252:1832-2365(-)